MSRKCTLCIGYVNPPSHVLPPSHIKKKKKKRFLLHAIETKSIYIYIIIIGKVKRNSY